MLTPKSLVQSKSSEPAPNKSDMIVTIKAAEEILFSVSPFVAKPFNTRRILRVLRKNPGCELVSHTYGVITEIYRSNEY